MDRTGLITLEQARTAGLSFAEPEPRTCPHCGAALELLGAALAGKVAWVSAAPCPCEGAAREREAEEHRRADLAAREEVARREKALFRAGVSRRYWAAEADRPELAEYIASFAGNGGAGLYIHGGVGAGKTHAASAMARLFIGAGYEVSFTTAKGMLERVKATFDEGGTEAAIAGGFAMTLVRNETQRHSAVLKSAGQNPIGLLPLNRPWRLACAVEHYSVNFAHFVSDAVGNFCDHIIGHAAPISTHRIFTTYWTKHNGVPIRTPVSLHTHRTYISQQYHRALPNIAIQPSSSQLLTHDSISVTQNT